MNIYFRDTLAVSLKYKEMIMNLQLEKWTDENYNEFVELLKENADEKYRKFHSSLVPNTEKNEFIGVRMPKLREIGKEISKGNPHSFLSVSKPQLYEEKMVRGIVTGLIKPNSFEEFVSLCDSFAEEVNNWALCDCFCSGLKQVKKYKSEFFEYISKYLESNDEWKIRVALVLMLNYYLEDEYIDRVLKRCDEVENKAYYVSMAQAWLVATALFKCREKTMQYLHNNKLDDVTFNKAIQKSIESLRIDKATKDYLRSIKRK